EDLPVAGHARREVQAMAVPAADAIVVIDHQGSGADEAHLTLEDVQELRKLVERCSSKEAPYAGDAWVLRDLEEAVGLVEAPEIGLLRVSAIHHRPKLEDLEAPSVAPDPRLNEEQRPRRVKLDRDAEKQKDRQGQEHQKR